MAFEEGNKIGPRFKPGQSGNPNGRPKGLKSFRTRILEMAEKEIDYTDIKGNKTKTTMGEALVMGLYGKAVVNNDIHATKVLMEYADEKGLKLTGDPEKPVTINIVDDARRQISEMLRLAASARASSRTFEDEMDS